MQVSAPQNVRPMAGSPVTARNTSANALDAVLVGGDLLFREGLKRVFSETPIRVCAEAEALDAIHKLSPAMAPDVVVLLDPAMVRDGAGALAELRRAWPGARMVVLARRPDAGLLSTAVEAGIDGYLLTDMSPAALVHALNLVRLGENVFPTRLAAELVRPRAAEGRTGRPINLTGRELDILRGLLDGQSNKMIANRLGTTDATVKAQLRHLLRKIGAENRTQAALWARERGIGREAA